MPSLAREFRLTVTENFELKLLPSVRVLLDVASNRNFR